MLSTPRTGSRHPFVLRVQLPHDFLGGEVVLAVRVDGGIELRRQLISNRLGVVDGFIERTYDASAPEPPLVQVGSRPDDASGYPGHHCPRLYRLRHDGPSGYNGVVADFYPGKNDGVCADECSTADSHGSDTGHAESSVAGSVMAQDSFAPNDGGAVADGDVTPVTPV